MNFCELCSHCIPIGEGDHLCELTNDIVIEDYMPTEKYATCNDDE